jgi:hypothetical protein
MVEKGKIFMTKDPLFMSKYRHLILTVCKCVGRLFDVSFLKHSPLPRNEICYAMLGSAGLNSYLIRNHLKF